MAAINVHVTNGRSDHLSRQEIVNWVNNSLGTYYVKIEELCTGIVLI